MICLYIATPDGLLVVRGSGTRWTAARHLAGCHVQCVAVDRADPRRVYCGTMGLGLWRSPDAGESWAPSGSGISTSEVTAIVVGPAASDGAPGVVYAGTEPSRLYRSDDGGATWHTCAGLLTLPSVPTWSFPPRPYTHHVRAIALDPHAPERLLVAIEAGGVMRSPDGGETWTDRTAGGPYDAHTLTMHPAAPGRVYAAAGDGLGTAGRGYTESRDGGATWQPGGGGLRQHYLWGLAVDPGDPDTVVISAAAGPYPAHNVQAAESHVYRRAGGGAWQEVALDPAGPRGMLAANLGTHAAEPGVFYAVSNRGLYRSPDAGVSWGRLPIPWPAGYESQHIEALAVSAR